MTLAVRAQTLPVGAAVRDWRVDGVVSVSEEAVVYNALHLETGESVLLQEYFPLNLGQRQPDGTITDRGGPAEAEFRAGRQTFLMQGAALAGLSASRPIKHLPNVRAVFAHGGTAYMVLECYGGAPLLSELALGHRLPEERLVSLFRPMVQALGQLHDLGICHLRIHPGVILRQQRRLMLTGFAGGFVSREWEDEKNAAYSPIEVLVPVAEPGPWSDIYALGAVLYHCVTGAPPPEAVSRLGDVELPPACAEEYSPAFLQSIVAALSCIPADRPQSVHAWCEAWPQSSQQQPEGDANAARAGPVAVVARDAPDKTAPANLVPVDTASAAQPRRFWNGLAGQIALPCLGGVVMAGGILLALSSADRFFPNDATATSMTMTPGAFAPPEDEARDQNLSAPLLLLEHELASARDTVKHIEAQATEAEALKWPAERVAALRQAADQAEKAVAEMEALYAAPDLADSRRASSSFLTVLEEQGKSARGALRQAWEISVAGYADGADRLLANGEANFNALKKLLANDDGPEPVLLMGTAATAYELMKAAHRRLQQTADAQTPENAMAASRHLAEVSAVYGEVRSQANTIREALRSGQQHADERADELSDLAREHKAFRAALLSARRTATELERALAAAREGSRAITSERRAYVAARLKESSRRLAGLEQIVVDDPDMRGPRLEAALTEVRETEKGLRGLLQELGRQPVAGAKESTDPAVLRLVRRADSRLARNYRRYAELQELLAKQDGIIRVKGGDTVGGQDMNALYRDLKAQAALRERLSAARQEAEAQTLYEQFAHQHERVDDQLDRMLRVASKAARL